MSNPNDDPNRSTAPIPTLVDIRRWAGESGFQHVGIVDVDQDLNVEAGLRAWLAREFHGEMAYMADAPQRRADPRQLLPGSVRAVMVGMDYRPAAPDESQSDWITPEWQRLRSPQQAVVSVYARGRDYHKLVRKRLQRLADRISDAAGAHGYRAFCDSAPVMEVTLAERSGLGWRGKHTLLLNRSQGSMFFIGTLLTNLPLPVTEPADAHCGSCRRCIDVCPTGAIVAPYRLDARRCISYLTIELPGRIDPDLRPLIGNRVYGCDDCQLICPWNKFARAAATGDFAPRHGLDRAGLLDLFGWSEQQFDQRTLGSPIRRIGYQRWSRNLAVALGNLPRNASSVSAVRQAIATLQARMAAAGPMLAEHIDWAINRLRR